MDELQAISTAPRDGTVILLWLKNRAHLRGNYSRENGFALAYWATLGGDTPWWQAVAGGNAAADFDGSILGYEDADIDGWFVLPSPRT